jgi:hypothetical protein
MGAEIAALSGLFGLTSLLALIATVLAGFMAWRIVEKAGFPGWAGLGAILVSLTGIGSVVPLVLLWVFAFMRWPRDDAPATVPGAAPRSPPHSPSALPPPPKALAPPPRRWQLAGNGFVLTVDGTSPAWIVTGAPSANAYELSIGDPSVGQPHARLLVSGDRLGLEDLGSPGGTLIDGARLVPEHGPRDISAVRTLRFGTVELALSRA